VACISIQLAQVFAEGATSPRASANELTNGQDSSDGEQQQQMPLLLAHALSAGS
jgi:hypothetical protein